MDNISKTLKTNLCISCGICINSCPAHCISWSSKKDGMYFPQINENQCTECGLCADICPGLGFKYPENTKLADSFELNYLESYNVWSKNDLVRHCSASGGFITTLVRHLLDSNTYDVFFSIDSYDYSQQLKTVAITKEQLLQDIDFSKYPKSRYLPVSHENVVAYIRKNKDKRVIIVGTSCAIRGISDVIEKFKLTRENYLLIGLFCDKVFTYNIYDYFCERFSDNKKITAIHFKNKESGGWPGDLKFFYDDGTYQYQDISERSKVKEFFVPERCLYCVDKLNICADISAGDNYTEIASSKLGSNSVIIRTELGKTAFDSVRNLIEYVHVPLDDILKAQDVKWRSNNYYCGKIKERKSFERLNINMGLISEDKYYNYQAFFDMSQKKRKCYKKKGSYYSYIKKHQNKGIVSYMVCRLYYAVRRRIVRILFD